MRSIVGPIFALGFAGFFIQAAAIAAPNEFRLSRDGVGPIVVVTNISINGNEAQLKASARNDSGQPIRHAKFCISAEGRAKGCDFELWTTTAWKPGEELTWAPLKGHARLGIQKVTVRLTELDSAVARTPARPNARKPAPSSPQTSAKVPPVTPAQPAARLQPATGVAIQDGTPLRLRIKRTVSSADARVGDTVNFEVLDEIKVGDVVMIPKSGTALGTVTQAVSARSMDRGGELSVVVDHARLINGDKIPLRVVKENQSGGQVSATNGAIVSPSAVFFPAAPFLLFVQGKDITVPNGTELTAFVNGDYPIDLAKFKSATAGGPFQRLSSTAIAGTTGVLTNEDISAFRQAGLSDEVILAKIKTSKGFYKINADGIIALWKVGVSDAVILAMSEAASR